MKTRLLNIDEASEYLGIKKTTLRCFCSRRIIPYVKFGRMVRFDIDQLNKWVEENSKQPENLDDILAGSREGFRARVNR